MDRDSMGETPPACAGRSVMFPWQAAGLPNNLAMSIQLQDEL